MITSTSNNKVKEIRKLKQRKYRDETKQFMIEGQHLIEEALKYKVLKTIITTDESFVSDVETILVSDNVFSALSNQQSASGLIGICDYLETKLDLNSDIVALDRIQDPGNCGTIMRSALAFNYKNLILNQGSVDVYNPKSIQASQGALFGLNIQIVDFEKAFVEYKKQGYTLIGSALEKAKPLALASELQAEKRVICFGNEGQGMAKNLLDLMDVNYFIEINNIESLNVASASAIMLYELAKK